MPSKRPKLPKRVGTVVSKLTRTAAVAPGASGRGSATRRRQPSGTPGCVSAATRASAPSIRTSCTVIDPGSNSSYGYTNGRFTSVTPVSGVAKRFAKRTNTSASTECAPRLVNVVSTVPRMWGAVRDSVTSRRWCGRVLGAAATSHASATMKIVKRHHDRRPPAGIGSL